MDGNKASSKICGETSSKSSSSAAFFKRDQFHEFHFARRLKMPIYVAYTPNMSIFRIYKKLSLHSKCHKSSSLTLITGFCFNVFAKRRK